jgi:hypothetical protein
MDWGIQELNPVGRNYLPVQTRPRAHPASHTMGTASLPGVKQPDCGISHPPPSNGEVKGVHLSLYSLSVSSWQDTGWSWHLNCYQSYIMAVRHGPVLQLSQTTLHTSVTFTEATKIQWCMQVCYVYTQLNCNYLCVGHAGKWGLIFSHHCLYRGQATNHCISCVLMCSADETEGRRPVQITRAQSPSMIHMFLSFSIVSLFVDCTN